MEDKEKFFRQLINDNHERIYRICSYHSSGRDDCDDLYQQVMINTWQALNTFRGDSKISTWIYRIALNTAIDFNRAEKRQMILRQKYHTEIVARIHTDDERWQKMQDEVHLEAIKTEINQLSIIEKLVISLVFENISMKEIADIIGITEPNVRVKIHRIKQNLKLKLGGNYDE
jgi:RNA polymerase sigma-70 factor, ECF subfamily